jgi:thymidylate synthase
MNKADFYYINNIKEIINNGFWDKDPRPKYKDGTQARSKFITDIVETYDISKGEFPIPTLRNTAIKTGIKEIFWIYQMQSNKLDDAHDLGITWWDEWDIGDGSIGERYGFTVKKYNLINTLLYDLKNNPFSRRHIINLYQYSDLNNTKGLNPCAYETIWNVRDIGNDRYLDMRLIQRSNDYLIAGFINKIQYVGLLMMVAGHLGYKVGKFTHYTINLHIYDRHFDAMYEVLERNPILDKQPYITLNENKNFYDYTINDFTIHNTEDIKKIKSPLELAI